MLGKRYKYDGKPIIRLNPLQKQMKRQIESKVKNGHYKMEKIPCAICGSNNFEQLSEKERHGLYLSVFICRD